MNRVRRWLALPLLAKELTESSARWRTYGARVLFAVGLYALVAMLLPSEFWRLNSTESYSLFSVLGSGRRIFERLAGVQAVGIALFLPAMMCGCITQEKERDSLVLLLLTELRPWQILLQKYLGGLVPVLCFVLLGAPLMAVAYALGGLETGRIVAQAVGIVLVIFQLGALTLLCSVWCRTTVGALLSSYLLGALMYLAPPIITLSFFRGYSSLREVLAFLLVPPALLEIASDYDLRDRALILLPSIFSVFLFLGLARFFFLRRAFIGPSEFLPRLFRRLDQFFQRANRFTGGVMVLGESGRLPADAPIFWRETRTRALGRPHYLLRIFVVTESLTALLCLLQALAPEGDFSVLIAVLGSVAILVVAVQAANVIISERVNQTLEVLLTTPLAGAQIIREKERALFRLLLVVATPLLTVFGVEFYLRTDETGWHRELGLRQLGCAFLAVVIYLPLVAWLAMTIGLWLRTRLRAIIVTLVVLVCWFVLPLIVAEQFFERPHIRTSFIPTGEEVGGRPLCQLLSPAGILILSRSGGARSWSLEITWPVVVANFAVYGAIALGLRTVLAARADRWLRRQ